MQTSRLNDSGNKEGRQEGRIQIACQLLANGVDRAVVRLSTGLTDNELDNLPAPQ
ncbi:hypothetical protein SGGMMB4_04403 [Sodalis glossinidius str. 'morsitans']|uniref:Transposase n=1 Tax=Sodalis glossinidius (strain morsitans) TaxID=343509 RepID=A0A193QLW7_SODGM|nr:hypothetical protein [Sodalis glossinidius]CRL46093.1 hypothetical protein SGGMMB4_04403 [Sodalis glossinidius str. 'morsitans']